MDEEYWQVIKANTTGFRPARGCLILLKNLTTGEIRQEGDSRVPNPTVGAIVKSVGEGRNIKYFE